MELRKTGSLLQGHPCRDCVPGVEFSTGLLAWHLGALEWRLPQSSLRKHRVYVLCGVGDERGPELEAIMACAKFMPDNL
jgi:transketolase